VVAPTGCDHASETAIATSINLFMRAKLPHGGVRRPATIVRTATCDTRR
jgi:hypothetical protein